MENLENTEKSSMYGKIMEFEKNMNNRGKIMTFMKWFEETTSSQKTSCRTLVSPTASFLATGGFKL